MNFVGTNLCWVWLLKNIRHVSLWEISQNIITGIGNFSRCSREPAMLIRHVILLMLEFAMPITANTLSVKEVSKFYSFYIYRIYTHSIWCHLHYIRFIQDYFILDWFTPFLCWWYVLLRLTGGGNFSDIAECLCCCHERSNPEMSRM